MAEHFETKKYKINESENKQINVNGNKIIGFFAKQAKTDELSTRIEPSGARFYDWFKGCEKILDIGAGSGSSLNELRKRGHSIVGVTVNFMERAIARQEHKIDLVLADMHDLPFEDNTVDGILMWDVLEHSLAPYIAMNEVRRVLKVGGKLLLYMPGEEWIECSYHYSVMTPRQMLFLLRRLGFDVSPETTYNENTKEGIYKATKIEFDEIEFNKKYFR